MRLKLEQNAVLERRVAERTEALAREIDEHKRTEVELRHTHESLIHAAKLAALGRMSAAIVHEVSQPLAGIITNASTCLRMLAADPPNVDGARETARRTLRDGPCVRGDHTTARHVQQGGPQE